MSPNTPENTQPSLETPQPVSPETVVAPAGAEEVPDTTLVAEFNKVMSGRDRTENEVQTSVPESAADVIMARQQAPGYDPDARGGAESGYEVDGGL